MEDDVLYVFGLNAEEELVSTNDQTIGVGGSLCLPATGRVRLETSFPEYIARFEHHSSSVRHCDLNFSILDEIDAVGQIAQMEDHCLLLKASLMHMRGQ